MKEQLAKSSRINAGDEKNLRKPISEGKSEICGLSTFLNGHPIQRKASCACGGGCPGCQAKSSNLPVSQPNDASEIEADQIAGKVMRMPAEEILLANRRAAKTNYEQGKDNEKIRRKKNQIKKNPGSSAALSVVGNILNSSGQSLEDGTKNFFESRFKHDFSSVRIYTDAAAANSAASLDAKAYTLGNDIVFGRGEYMPDSESGKHLLAHELTHIVQHRTGVIDKKIQRTPASKVSCANHLPLVIPGTPPITVADPVGVITAAENRANQMFDDVISEIDFTQQNILAGAEASFPTISDALAQGLVLMGINPDDRAMWIAPRGTGQRSVTLLLRRLRLVRNTIGAGSFFFFCLGTGMTRLGGCVSAAGAADICTGAVLTTCAGEFLTAMCPSFWNLSAENQAARIVHESAHNFAAFIGHTGRFTNAECFARLIQVFAGVPEAEQRVDLCPNP